MSAMPRIVILSNMPVTEGISGKIRGIRNMYGYLTDAEWHQINTVEGLKKAERDYTSEKEA